MNSVGYHNSHLNLWLPHCPTVTLVIFTCIVFHSMKVDKVLGYYPDIYNCTLDLMKSQELSQNLLSISNILSLRKMSSPDHSAMGSSHMEGRDRNITYISLFRWVFFKLLLNDKKPFLSSVVSSQIGLLHLSTIILHLLTSYG